MFQSPQWGSNSKASEGKKAVLISQFQSPQWGSNSKGEIILTLGIEACVSVPAMGK